MEHTLHIITVTKNDTDGIDNTIRSTKYFRHQAGVKQFIIDSSDKGIKEKVELLTKSHKNVNYIWQKPSGIASAFNLGLSFTDAKWVWFLNGGDQVHKEVDIEKIIYLLQQSNADAIIFQLQRMGSNEILSHPPMWAMWPPLNSWIPHPATITRRKLYHDFGKFNESFEIAMDYEFWLRCFANKVTVDTLSIPLTLFDTHGISNSNKNKVSREAARIIKMHFGSLIKLWFKNGLNSLVTWKNFYR